MRHDSAADAPGEVEFARSGEWPWPRGVWMVPHEVLAPERKGLGLDAILDLGENFLFDEGDYWVLSHWRGSQQTNADVDIWFRKEDENIVRIEWVFRFDYTAEQMANLVSIDLLEAKICQKVYEFDDYQESNGVQIPLWIHEKLFDNSSLSDDIISKLNSGAYTFEAYVKELIAHRGEATVLSAERLIQISPNQLTVNTPIPESAFVLKAEVGDSYLDRRVSDEVRLVLPWYRRPWFLSGCAVVTAALLLLAYYLRRGN